MIDYVKILITGIQPNVLGENPNLNFYYDLNPYTGEIRTVNRYGNKISPNRKALYKGLEFTIYDTGTILVKGSLHKYHNNGIHNYNDFDFEAYTAVLNNLKTLFNIKPENCLLKGMEAGININPPIEANEIISNALLHKTTLFEFHTYAGKGRYKQAQHSQYIVKLYNKGLQYKELINTDTTEILRFEIKYTKMERLNKNGIYTLKDITAEKFEFLKSELQKEWENTLFYDNTTRIDHLSTKQKKAIINYRNPNYWQELLENGKRENFKYHKREMQNIIRRNSNNIQDLITTLISNKVDHLKGTTTQNDHLSILSNQVVRQRADKPKLCSITGIDISTQKEDSTKLSHTGLWLLWNNDRNAFEIIKKLYLSKKWANSNIKTQIKEIAHNIRNTSSNRNRKQYRIYPKEQLNFLSLLYNQNNTPLQ